MHVCCAGVATSQNQVFKAHLVGGPSFCQVDGDRFSGYNKLGFHGGIAITHQFNENWSGGFELLYATKGSKKRIDPKDLNPEIFIISAQYVEMPIVANYQLAQWPKFSFGGGLSFGVNVGGTVDDGIAYNANFKKSEIALFFQGGYAVSERLTIRLRHANSLFRVGDDYPNGLNWFYRVGLYNRLYMGSLVYSL